MTVRARMRLAVGLPDTDDTGVRPHAGATAPRPRVGDTDVRPCADDTYLRPRAAATAPRPHAGDTDVHPHADRGTVRPRADGGTARPRAGRGTVLPPADGSTVVPRTGHPAAPAVARRRVSPFDFASFERLARTAERGLFDFLLLSGVPGSPVHDGRVHAPDTVGRPEATTVLNALAAVTERLGLAVTADAISGEPYELARRLATLDHLSEGRAAWNVVTSPDAAAAGNLRRGGCPDARDAYPLAVECVEVARQLWDAWTPDGVSRPIAHRGRYFDIEGEFTVPRPPQGHPVVIHAGDSPAGREFAARAADVVLADWGSGDGLSAGRFRPGALEAGRALRAELNGRLAAYGRSPEELKIMPLVGFVLGDTAAEARERAGRTVVESSGRRPITGTPEAVAAELDEGVRTGAADGFVLVPPATPGALEEFVDRVVPLLQERGAFRTEYTGTTLRSHLGLAEPVWKG